MRLEQGKQTRGAAPISVETILEALTYDEFGNLVNRQRVSRENHCGTNQRRVRRSTLSKLSTRKREKAGPTELACLLRSQVREITRLEKKA